jgi:DNA-binding CsgD family transcriptional regulator
VTIFAGKARRAGPIGDGLEEYAETDGMDAGLRWLTERFAERTQISADYSSHQPKRLADDQETQLFPIAQDALTNIARHSGATEAKVRLDTSGDQVLLRIEDNGRGMPAETSTKSRRGRWRRGEAHLSPSVADAVLTDDRKHVTNPVDLLTAREREVLRLIAEGGTNKDIANQLSLSVYTVEGHRGRLREKLNPHSTGDLVRFAIRSGFIS